MGMSLSGGYHFLGLPSDPLIHNSRLPPAHVLRFFLPVGAEREATATVTNPLLLGNPTIEGSRRRMRIFVGGDDRNAGADVIPNEYFEVVVESSLGIAVSAGGFPTIVISENTAKW